MSFNVDTIWTATMVYENGRWLLASFQFAPSIFNNPVLDQAVNALYWVSGIVALIGLVLGFLAGRLTGKRRREAT
jgi:NhaP-type Na+/H+ or K+/H+ antiporter